MAPSLDPSRAALASAPHSRRNPCASARLLARLRPSTRHCRNRPADRPDASCRPRGRRRRAKSSSRRSKSRRSTIAAKCRRWRSCSPTSSAPRGIPDADIHVMPYEALARRQDRRADRPLALAQRDEEADADPRPHGRGRGQARGLEVRSVRVPRGGRLFPRPRHERHEEWRRRDDHGGGQADVAKGSSPTATSSSSTAATRRPAAAARRLARPSGAT